MDLRPAWRSGWLRAVIAVGFLGILTLCARQTQAQTSRKSAESAVAARATRNVCSRNFLIHTDLSQREADELVEQLEVMLREISAYWGRPMQGTIECYIVRDFDNFPLAAMNPWGVCGVRTAGGITLMRTATTGTSYLAKSVVYASARPEVVRHEAVHAYCHQTFGRIGPVWYSEGMAEMGHYWKEGDSAVRVDPREMRFLNEHPPKTLADTLSPTQVTGDSWQNYASRWALCHFLVHDPNYAPQFLSMGRGILAGKDIRFDQTYAAVARELWFEYLFFLQHIGPGYRVDLCAWDWNKRFAALRPNHTLMANVRAGCGWQPTGISVTPGTQYDYSVTGNWRVARESKAVDANGDGHGRGRLVGVVMNDFHLSSEFDLGDHGSLKLKAAGDLYLRCRNAWNELTDDFGHVEIKFERQAGVGAPRKAGMPAATAAAAKAVRVAGRDGSVGVGSMNAGR